jgi:RecG-like helicase
LLGTRQSGLSDLRFAHLRRDRNLLERARAAAPAIEEGPLLDAAAALFAEIEPESLA